VGAFQVRRKPMMQGKIEANLSAGSQMTIWRQPRTSAELYGSDAGYRRMYRCFLAMDNRNWLTGRTVLSLGVPVAEPTHDTIPR
jgi:hypothetical protein